MSAYFEYLREMFIKVMVNIGLFIADIFAGPWTRVPSEFSDYNDLFTTYTPNFGVMGWIFYVIFWILLAALIAGLGYLIYRFGRRHLKFRKTELDKQALRDQVERLNYELYQAVQERDKILNLKVTAMGLKMDDLTKTDKNVVEEVASRFPKLKYVDHEYADLDVSIPEVENISLEEICNRFRLFAASQLKLYYTVDTIRQLFAGMAASKLIILEGISGTGKTSMPYALGKFFDFDANICSVQPSWKDRSELLGYYNEFTKKFNETEFLRALYTATYRKDLNIIVLDEMNLARIEYYFAEFLSIMEMPNFNEWIVDVIAAGREDDPVHLKEGKLLIPQNIWFVGTANNDDSTFTITDKVYDRAVSLFFENKSKAFDAPYTEALPLPAEYLLNLYAEAKKAHPISPETLEKFEQLDEFVIEHFKLAFGNRIMKQIHGFVPCYIECGGTELEAFDFLFKTKILKKFEVLNVAFLRDELSLLDEQLTKLFGKNEFLMSRDKIRSLIKMSR